MQKVLVANKVNFISGKGDNALMELGFSFTEHVNMGNDSIKKLIISKIYTRDILKSKWNAKERRVNPPVMLGRDDIPNVTVVKEVNGQDTVSKAFEKLFKIMANYHLVIIHDISSFIRDSNDMREMRNLKAVFQTIAERVTLIILQDIGIESDIFPAYSSYRYLGDYTYTLTNKEKKYLVPAVDTEENPVSIHKISIA